MSAAELTAGIVLVAENDDFLVVNKPAGLSVHKDDNAAGLVMLLQQHLNLQELYLVHRLDQMTSGLLLLAKRRTVAAELGQLFEQRQMTKFYVALSDQKPKKKQGLISGDMVKSRRGSWKLTNTRQNPAKTQFFSHNLAAGKRLFLLRPVTGKTHQLRVALKSIGAPVLGDKRYHSADSAEPRGYLHAWYLAFSLQGQAYSFRCLPDDAAWLCEQWPENWQQPEQLSWPVLSAASESTE